MGRYVIYGAGAIGATIGGRLHAAGREVVLIARGAHLEALKRRGLTLRSPDEQQTLAVPTAPTPAAAGLGAEDVVVLAMKTQDTAAALAELALAAPPGIAVACAQNGVANERLALRHVAEVYAICVYLPAEHLEPGVVDFHCSPCPGILDLGPYPETAPGPRAAQIAADLTAAGFAAEPKDAIMGWKYEKLLANLGNAVDALTGARARETDLYDRARAEGLAVYAAAGITIPDDEAVAARRTALSPMRPIAGARRGGGSSWQSLARGAGAIEADWLNGEIVLLGRLHGVPTPVNEALRRAANRVAAQRGTPGAMTIAALEAEVDAGPGTP